MVHFLTILNIVLGLRNKWAYFGNKILNKLDIIYTEINYDYVYKNCALVSDIDNLLKKYNFVRYYTSDVKNKKNISVWGDAIYLKKKLVQKYN